MPKQYLFGGLRPSDERQKHRNRARAELHFRRAEPRAGRGNGDVASKRQFERSADAIAMDGGDRRLGAIPERHDEVEIGLSGRCSSADQKHASGIAGRGDSRDVEIDCGEFIEVVILEIG